jgi:hypothetical protein
MGRVNGLFNQIKRHRHFPFHLARVGVKMRMSYDQTGFATSRTATPEIAALVQGLDAVQTFQSAHVFS